MSPRIATIVFAAGIAVLFYLNRDEERRSSPALWIAAAWIFIGSSRMVSQWLAGELLIGQADFYLEGSPSDRLFLSLVLGVALIVLLARADRAGALLRANAPLLMFFGYCALSILWSDFTYVALKRWTRALGNLTMVLLILTDPQAELAVRRVFARAGFLLIPLSILFIKYYPDLGRFYSHWTWTSTNIGVSTDKNGLGAICLVFGLVSMWRFIDTFFDKTNPLRMRVLCAHGAVLAMASWLFVAADSSTALVCFLLGSALILFTVRPGTERPASVNLIVAAIVVLPLFLGFVFQDAYSYAVQGLGRNITLTGRTELWADLFRMDLNQFVGTGFESFWLGERAEHFWNKYEFHPNQAHNGYIELYINLGWIGVILFAVIVVAGYRNVLHLYQRDPNAGSLRLAFFIVALIYSLTEAAFKVAHPLWIAFLLAVTAVPPLRRRKRSPVKVPFAGAPAAIAADATPALPVA
jgi:exopolysaccharide production protein ExoQ